MILTNFLYTTQNKRAIIVRSVAGSTCDAPLFEGGPDRVIVSATCVVQSTNRMLEHQQENCDAYYASSNSKPCVFLVKQTSSARRGAIKKVFLIAMGEEALPPSPDTYTVFAASPVMKPAQTLVGCFIALSQGLFA